MTFTLRSGDPAPEHERPHNRLLASLLDALGLVHGELRGLRQTVTENGVRLQGARYLPLPANAPNSGRITLATSAVELLGWVLTETSGAAAVKVTFEDASTSGAQTGATFPVAVAAGLTSAERWNHGISLNSGLSLSYTGQVAGVVLVR